MVARALVAVRAVLLPRARVLVLHYGLAQLHCPLLLAARAAGMVRSALVSHARVRHGAANLGAFRHDKLGARLKLWDTICG